MAIGFLRGKHARLREQLSAYLDDELTPPERFEMEHHLESCLECRAELEELRTIAWATSQLPELPVTHSYTVASELPAVPVAATAALTSAPRASAVAGRRPPWYLVGWV